MRICIGALFLILILGAVAQAAPRIEVKSFMQHSEGNKITLGRILSFEDVQPQVIETLKPVVLGDAPPLGEKRVFSNLAISQVIRQKLAKIENGRDIKLIIPSRVTIENRGFELSEASIKSYLVNQWQAQCGECQIVIQGLNLPIVPASVAMAEMNINLPSQTPRGQFTVPLKVMDKGQSKTYWISGKLEVRKKVPVLTRSMNMGERVHANDIKVEYRDVTFATDGISEVNQLVGRQLKRNLRADDIVWSSYVDRIKALRRGEVVRVISGEDAWSVTMNAVAQQDGYIGDVIPLKNLASQKVISGQVTGVGEVTVK